MFETTTVPQTLTDAQAESLGISAEDYQMIVKGAAAFTQAGGGQDRKYKMDNGRFVNRISGEAIPIDEPTVIFRARDAYSLDVLKKYLSLVHDETHRKAVQDRINEFETFAELHPDRMKEPGTSGHIVLNDEADGTNTGTDPE